MRNVLLFVIFLSSISFAKQSGVPPLQADTCYIKWDSKQQQAQVERDREMYQAHGVVLAKYKLNNEQVRIMNHFDKDTYMAVIGNSKYGQKYIFDQRQAGNTKVSYATDALIPVKTSDLEKILIGFEIVSCDEPFITSKKN